MATQIFSTDVTTTDPFDHAIDAAGNDIIIVRPDVLIAATGENANAINGTSGIKVELLGTLLATDSGPLGGGHGISLLDSNEIIIGASASIFAEGEGVGVHVNGLNTIVNQGLIKGFFGIEFTYISASNTVHNSGTIWGTGEASILGQGSDDSIYNTGLLIGGVYLGGGNDLYDGRGGIVRGTILLGAGNDTAYGGVLSEIFEGGADDDLLFGGGGDDTFNADNGDGDDTIDGGDGRDTYDGSFAGASLFVDLDEGLASGGAGNDNLDSIENVIGSFLADTLQGDDISNILRGSNDNDSLFGAGGRDFLDGGDDNDLLVGGLGRDLLRGGLGADVFDFDTVAESGITGVTRDRILDFQDGIDDINLSTIDAKTFLSGNQAFSFIGAGAFTAAGGQIRAIVSNAGNTVIQINTDKDSAAEMSIVLLGTHTLHAGDFVL
jgi:Ca2+-binding RTX toxin-like protein